MLSSWRCFLCNEVTRIPHTRKEKAEAYRVSNRQGWDYTFKLIKGKYRPCHLDGDPDCSFQNPKEIRMVLRSKKNKKKRKPGVIRMKVSR